MKGARALQITNKKEGWDIADAVAEGVDLVQFIAKCPTEVEPESKSKTTKASVGRLLIAMRGSGIEVFRATGDGEIYAWVPFNGGHETLKVSSRRFKVWITWFCDSVGLTEPKTEGVDRLIRLFEAQALCNNRRRVFTRYAPEQNGWENGVFVDLCDGEHSVVHITAKGWEILRDPKIHFVRTDEMEALPRPLAGGNLDDLWRFSNISDEGQRLLDLTFSLHVLRGVGPYCGSELDGREGSGKTFHVKTRRSILDPNCSSRGSMPSKEGDFIVAAAASAVPAFENMSELSEEKSDRLCKLADGGSFTKRRLFSNNDSVTVSVARPFTITTIKAIVFKPDLLSRLIRISVDTIPEAKREGEADLLAEFESKRASILGALYDLMSKVLAILPAIPKVGSKHRNPDYFRMGLAAEKALGVQAGTFERSLLGSIRTADDEVLEKSPVFEALTHLNETQWHGKEWRGTPTDLFKELDANTPESIKKKDHWPKGSNTLSGHIKEISRAMERGGWTYSSNRLDQRIITLKGPATAKSPLEDDDGFVRAPANNGGDIPFADAQAESERRRERRGNEEETPCACA